MGIFSDNIETAWENWEQAGQLLEPHGGFSLEQPRVKSPPPTFTCGACGERISTESAYRRHIATQHASEFMYVAIGGRVAQPLEFPRVRPNELRAVIMRPCVDLSITTGGRVRRSTLAAGEHDLLRFLPSSFRGLVTLCFRYGERDKRYDLAIHEAPVFRRMLFDPEIERLQYSLDTGIEPNWRDYEAVKNDPALNPFETRYLDGFYDYTIGFKAELKGNYRDAQSQLERSLQLLAPYDTGMAITAKRILGLRFNRFHLLDDATASSQFDLPRQFFSLGNMAVSKGSSSAHRNVRTSPAVYCDGLTGRLLAIIKAFYARDTANVVGPCEQLLNEPAVSRDYNQQVKLRLVLARTAVQMRDRGRMLREYAELTEDETFGAEARSAVMGHGIQG
jgi:hypothetical protein